MCENCDDIQKNSDTVTAQMMIRHARIETALENLFQACSRLCLDDMNKLEKEINEASAALGAAQHHMHADVAVCAHANWTSVEEVFYCYDCNSVIAAPPVM